MSFARQKIPICNIRLYLDVVSFIDCWKHQINEMIKAVLDQSRAMVIDPIDSRDNRRLDAGEA